MPPPIYMMPPPPQRGRGFVRGVFTVLATSILGISIALNIYFFLTAGLFSGGSSLRESTVLEGDPAQKVAIIPVSGLIDEDAAQRLDRFLRTAENDSNVKGIVLKIDSPGGTVAAADEMYHRIMEFRAARKDVPVVVSQGGLAASGGYYVSCAGDYIFAQPSTITGSIGVIMPNYNISKLMQKWGIDDTSLIATGATFKDAGSMTKPPDPQQVAYLQGLIDQNFQQFKGIVSSARGFTTQQIDRIADGKVYTAEEARQLKLIDQIGYERDACDYVASRLGLKNMTIVRYQNPASLLDILNAKSSVPSPGARTNVTINGIQVDARSLLEMMSPRPMYLWRGY
jgi:protease-4